MNTLEQQRKKREAFAYAMRSHEIESFAYTEEDKEFFEKIIRGELTYEEAIKKQLELARSGGKSHE